MTTNKRDALSKFADSYFANVYNQRSHRERLSVFTENLQMLQTHQSQGRLLDIGCAYGEFLSLAQKNFTIYGIDVSAFAIATARRWLKTSDLFVADAGKKLQFRKNFFDAVTCFDVIEHLTDPPFLISEIHRVLKPGGYTLITTPASGTLFSRFFGTFIPDDPTHINKQTYSYWINLFKRAGFTLVAAKTSLLYGFPPTTYLRNLWMRLQLPVTNNLIFSPITSVGATNYFLLRS